MIPPLKVLLIQPPVQDYYDTDIRLQPLGLCYLKSAVDKYVPGVAIRVLDFHCGYGRRTTPTPSFFSYLTTYYAYPDQSPFSAFYQYYHFGASYQQIAETVVKEKPDIVGISSLFTPYYHEVLETAAHIKAKMPVPIICGGSHVSAHPDSILSSEAVDFVIRGEGERAFCLFLEAFKTHQDWQKVPGLGFKVDAQLHYNKIEDNFALDDIPPPDFSNLKLSSYQFEKKPLSMIMTSRSCPHRCSFCSVHATFGETYRRRSISNILAEIDQRYREGVRVFDFEDDNLTFFQDEMKLLCRQLIARFAPQAVQFVAMNGISYLSLDAELLDLMRQAGFTHLNLSLVSSDKTVRQSTKRPHTVDKLVEIVHQGFELGFKIVCYQILGLPNESLASSVQTLCFIAGLPVLVGPSMFYLIPGTGTHLQDFAGQDWDFRLSRLTAMAALKPEIDRDTLYSLFICTRIINFLKGLPLIGPTSLSAILDGTALTTKGREQIGIDLLNLLWHERVLYAQTKNKRLVLSRFRIDVFAMIWCQLKQIKTQDNYAIINDRPF